MCSAHIHQGGSSSSSTRRRAGEVPSDLPRRRLDLKVLRGRSLVARDVNYVTEASSDPYCIVLVDAEEVGRTSVIHGTLNPVWATGNAFEAIDVSPTSVVTVRLADKDVMGVDKPMGEVRFVVGDWIGERASSQPSSPNRWFKVLPTDGCPCSGEIELRILLDSEKARPYGECGDKDPRRVLRQGGTKPGSMRRLSASKSAVVDDDGPSLMAELLFVWGQPESIVVAQIAKATTPVLLHIYDVGHSSWIAGLNSTTASFGGLFHAGVEIYGREFSFGGSRQQNVCGIFPCKPRGCVLHTYRESIYLGDCHLGRSHVSSILKQMRAEWPSLHYSMLRKNCCHFCNEFAIELGVGVIPSWTFRLANVGAALHDAINGPPDTRVSRPSPSNPTLHGHHHAASGGHHSSNAPSTRQAHDEQQQDEDIQGHLLDHVMAERIQTFTRKHSERKHRDAPSAPH